MLAAGFILLLVAALPACGASDDIEIQIPLAHPEFFLDRPRSERFPSREERVKLYMSNWYTPPCPQYDNGLAHFRVEPGPPSRAWPVYVVEESPDVTNRTTAIRSRHYRMHTLIEPDTAFVLDRLTVGDCAVRDDDEDDGAVRDVRYANRVHYRGNMYMYCLDVINSVLPAWDHVQWEVQSVAARRNDTTDVLPPVLLQFGDLKHSHYYKFISLPHLKKFRIAASAAELEHTTSMECYNGPRHPLKNGTVLQPIVWKLATRRHYGLVDQVIFKDCPWEEKKDIAVFRGQLTGSRDGYNKYLSDMENCMNLRRCRLVYNHANSTLVNARLTDTRGRLPDELNGVNLTTTSVTMRHLLRYKGIVMLEGNDVASGLKWALLSDSVVLMPVPRHTSWAMEELLQPWVHYVPLNEELTDVEEKMQWILDNEDTARMISASATLWMQDLVFHPDAAEDDQWIQEEILRRYSKYFAPAAPSHNWYDNLFNFFV